MKPVAEKDRQYKETERKDQKISKPKVFAHLTLFDAAKEDIGEGSCIAVYIMFNYIAGRIIQNELETHEFV